MHDPQHDCGFAHVTLFIALPEDSVQSDIANNKSMAVFLCACIS